MHIDIQLKKCVFFIFVPLQRYRIDRPDELVGSLINRRFER